MPPLPLLRRLDLYRITLGHLAPSQMYHRGRRLIRTRLLALRPSQVPAPRPFEAHVPRPFAMAATEVPEEARAVSAGRFRFIQMPEVHMPVVDWRHAPEGSLLWCFYLHYFGYAVELSKAHLATGEGRYAETAAQLMGDWIRHNPLPHGPGWHPYPTSRRLVAWCVAIAALQDMPAFRAALPELIASIEQQTDHLIRSREYDVRGNHLLANLQALAWVHLTLGSALPEPLRARLAPFLAEFWAEFLAQTKPDGSHEENSVSYQMIVCQDAFETLLLAERGGLTPPAGIAPRLEAMLTHLMSLLKPDGQLPMVNDTLQGYPMPGGELLAAGAAYFRRPDWKHVARGADLGYLRWLFGEKGLQTFEALEARPPAETSFGHLESGYCVIRSGWEAESDYMLFDCGPLGPRHLMAHAHADALSLEISALGQPILMDAGVYEYKAGVWRDHFRSTRAHNTVTVDGQSQSEMWASFRVARRAEAWLVDWRPGEKVSGAHDGYRRLPGKVEHQREVRVLGPQRWEIRDELTSQAAPHRYEWTYQLAPGADARLEGSRSVLVEHGGGVFSRFHFEGPPGLDLRLEQAWVSFAWNEKHPAPAIRLQLDSDARNITVSLTLEVTRP